tara:strand:- start:33108 stop:33569 length:462 start_codon:yes stop_codon:yes gene_type:complete
MTPSAYLCTKCRDIFPLRIGIDTCHKCDNKLVELYDKWQINKEFDDYHKANKILLTQYKEALSDPKLKKLCDSIAKAMDNKVVINLGLKNVKSVTQGDGKKIDKKHIYDRKPECYYCSGKLFIEKISLKGTIIETCSTCRTGMGGIFERIEDD